MGKPASRRLIRKSVRGYGYGGYGKSQRKYTMEWQNYLPTTLVQTEQKMQQRGDKNDSARDRGQLGASLALVPTGSETKPVARNYIPLPSDSEKDICVS